MQSALLSSGRSPFLTSATNSHSATHYIGIDTLISNQHSSNTPSTFHENYETPHNEIQMSSDFKSEAYYSNSDIQILHEIVKAAQSFLNTLPESESIPTSVLFRAYDDILPHHGIDPDNDQHFSRVLFRVGGEPGDDPLIKKFETVLDRMGIQIIFDDVTGAVTTEYPLLPRRHSLATVPEEQTHQLLAEAAEESSYESPSRETSTSPPPPPEISHSSPDITEPRLDKIFAVTPRPMTKTAAWLEEARRQMRELGIDDDTDTPATETRNVQYTEVARQREAAPSPDTRELTIDNHDEAYDENVESEKDTDDDEQIVEEEGDDADDEGYEPTQPINLGKHGGKRAPMVGSAMENFLVRSSDDNLTLTRPLEFEHVARNVIPNLTSPTQTTQPSQVLRRAEVSFDEMEARAALARDYHSRMQATKIFRWWRDKSKMYPATEEYYEAIAMTAQRRCTIQMTMQQWKKHAEYLRIQRIEEEKAAQRQREYMKIERIATRAGQIYTLTNNFAIWLAHAKEERERIGVARRHIMRKRHFDQWRNLVMSYNLISQQFILYKNLERWNEMASYLSRKDHKADVLCSNRIAKTTLREWKREGRERLAESTRDEMLCHRTIEEWAGIIDCSVIIQEHLEYLCQMAIVSKAMSTWQQCVEDRRSQWINGANSVACYQANIAWNVWSTYDATAHLEQAYAVDLTVTCLRDWNLEGKALWMQSRLNLKLRNTAFRDWLLLQRMQVFQRQRDIQRHDRVFASWLARSQKLENMDCDANIVGFARQASGTRVMNIFNRWLNAATRLGRAENRVCRREVTRTAVECFNLWQISSRQVLEMTRWSSRGEFFLTANKWIPFWIEKSKEIRKKRLAAAFTTGRSLQKERLVQRYWHTWEMATQRGIHQEHKCHVTKRKFDRQMVIAILETWQSTAWYTLSLDESIEVDSSERHLASLLDTWNEFAEIKSTLDSTAWALWAHHTATEAWEHWGTAVESLEFKESNASRREQKRALKLRDQTFLAWFEIATFVTSPLVASEEPPVWARTPAVQTPIAQSAQALSINNLGRFSSRSQSALNMTSNLPLQDLNDIMANTPSRRTGLARSVVALSSTTPSMALSTPKERELRATYDRRSSRDPRLTPAPVSFSQSDGQASTQSSQRPLRLALFQSRMASRPLDDLDEEPSMFDSQL